MSRALITIHGRADRERAIKWIGQAKAGTRLEFKGPKRTLPQNDKFWAALTDVATQVEWHGRRLTPDNWRLFFLDALSRELDLVPNMSGDGFVDIGRSSSNLSTVDFSDLLELVMMFGAQHGVIFHDQESAPLQPSELESA